MILIIGSYSSSKACDETPAKSSEGYRFVDLISEIQFSKVSNDGNHAVDASLSGQPDTTDQPETLAIRTATLHKRIATCVSGHGELKQSG